MTDTPEETPPLPVGSRLHQITEDDLAELERIVPELIWRLEPEQLNQTVVRKRAEKLKEILSNVRWGYGPPRSVEVVE